MEHSFTPHHPSPLRAWHIDLLSVWRESFGHCVGLDRSTIAWMPANLIKTLHLSSAGINWHYSALISLRWRWMHMYREASGEQFDPPHRRIILFCLAISLLYVCVCALSISFWLHSIPVDCKGGFAFHTKGGFRFLKKLQFLWYPCQTWLRELFFCGKIA